MVFNYIYFYFQLSVYKFKRKNSIEIIDEGKASHSVGRLERFTFGLLKVFVLNKISANKTIRMLGRISFIYIKINSDYIPLSPKLTS